MRKMRNDSVLDLGMCPNRKICPFTFMRFPVEDFPRSKIDSHKVIYNCYFKKNWSVSAFI